MVTPGLDDRGRAILLEVISQYIEQAEPVGSRSISKKHFQKLSPATIRNVMADLEEMGYLTQPHTSAGRIPTDKGYRYVVDQLLTPRNVLDLPESTGGEYDYGAGNQNLQDVLETACNSLSRNSNLTGLVMVPSFNHMLFKHIEFIKVSKSEALAVFVSEMGIMQNKIIPVEKEMTQERLTSISRYLNEEFSGKSIKAIREELVHRIRNEREHYNQLKEKALELSSRLFEEQESGVDLLVQGASNFLDQPEFSANVENMKALLKTLEEKTKLINLLDLCLQHDGMTVLIGQENTEEEMQECSLIAQNYGLGNEKMGAIAIVGPKRMNYEKIISIVNQTAQAVTGLLSERKEDFKRIL